MLITPVVHLKPPTPIAHTAAVAVEPKPYTAHDAPAKRVEIVAVFGLCCG